MNPKNHEELGMRKHMRVLGFGVAVLALALVCDLSADEKSAKDGVAKAAAALAKGEKINIDALKKEALDDLMNLFKLHKSGGFGLGDKRGAITPDGIELKIINLGKKTVKGDLDKQGDVIAEAAYRAAAIAEVTMGKCPIKKKEKDKDPADWDKWSKGMRDAALELAAAAKAKDAKKVEDAAKKLNNNCQHCHGIFRD